MANLIVEDKTGLENANVYVSVEDFKTFAELNGIELDQTDDELAVFLVKATNFIDSFEQQMVGKRLNPTQGLAFPRTHKSACNGSALKHLYDMQSLTKAVMYAVEAQVLGFSLLPTAINKTDIVKKEKIDVLEVQYAESLMDEVLLGKFPKIERYLSPYLIKLGYNLSVGR